MTLQLDAFLLSFAVIFVAELGDKSQLMALAFATRYRAIDVLVGISLATLLVHLGSVLLGATIAAALPTDAIAIVGGLAFFVFAVMLGQLLSISALALEEFSFRRHPRGREILRMSAYAAVENLGYRQLTVWWRVVSFYEYWRGVGGWGQMERRGLSSA